MGFTLSHQDGVYIARGLIFIAGIVLYVLGMMNSGKLLKIFGSYFSAVAHPINLAIFRIILFQYLWDKSNSSITIFFSGLPKELLYPPLGLEQIARALPIEPGLVSTIGFILGLSAFMAMIGFRTRFFAWTAVICAVYFMGISDLYGKVDHNHFIIWFAAILAASPCADVLSVDSILDRARKPRGGTVPVPPAVSNEYGLPIRLIYLLFGVIYFFPGFWKLYYGGLGWIFSDNLINYMYSKWFQLHGTLPFFRVDHYPMLCRFAAGAVILFEVSFIFLIFSDRFRYWAVCAGILFHILTLWFMQIDFMNLLRCYVVFVDWYGIYHWVELRVLKRPNVDEADDHTAIRPYRNRMVVWVGSILIIGNIYCGAFGIDSWPFSIFPTFAYSMLQPNETSMDIVMLTQEGREISFDDKHLSARFHSHNYWGLMKRILNENDPSVRARKLSALLSIAARDQPEIKKVRTIRMYRSVYSTLPADHGKKPLTQELLLTINDFNLPQ